MAQARVYCTCKKCGAEFEKVATKHNRREADSWEEWAKNYFDLCPDCERQAKKEREKAKGLIVEFRLDSNTAMLQGEFSCVAVVTNCGYEYKEQLKALGYRWVSNVPRRHPGELGNALYDGQKCWAKRVGRDGTTAAYNEIVALGAKCVVPSDYEKQQYADLLSEGAEKAAIRRERDAAALVLLGPKPEYPQDVAAIFAGGRWNGKIYGRPGNWSVYIDGEKRAMTNAQKQAMEEIDRARAEWEARKAEMK